MKVSSRGWVGWLDSNDRVCREKFRSRSNCLPSEGLSFLMDYFEFWSFVARTCACKMWILVLRPVEKKNWCRNEKECDRTKSCEVPADLTRLSFRWGQMENFSLPSLLPTAKLQRMNFWFASRIEKVHTRDNEGKVRFSRWSFSIYRIFPFLSLLLILNWRKRE